MRLTTLVTAAALTTAVSVGFAGPSFAQYNQYPGAPQPNPPPPPSQMAPNGEYVAPLSQQTQQVYVPQSVALSGPRMIKDWQEGEPIPPATIGRRASAPAWSSAAPWPSASPTSIRG